LDGSDHEDKDPDYWKKVLEVPVEVNGKKHCKVCSVDVEVSGFVVHVKQHQKECEVPLLPVSSQKFLRENDGLIVKTALPLIEELDIPDILKKRVQKELDPEDLIGLLNSDYSHYRHVFYSKPGTKLHENLSYQVPNGKKPFL
jgi:hypothetical protein